MKDYYAALEVGTDSDVVLIRESYRRLIRQNFKDPKAFRQLNEAYTVLGDPGKRSDYDRRQQKEPDGGATEDLLMTNEQTPQAQELPKQCPMGAGAMCPVISGRVPLGDQFCPECGVELAQIGAMLSQPAAAAQAAPNAWLEEDTGRHHALHAGANAVGRETGDVVLQDKTVSREHARITLNPDGTITVEDLASTNGTKINGERLTPHFPRPVSDMDSLTFGSILARLKQAGSDPKPIAVDEETAVPGLVSAPLEEDPIARMLTNFDVEAKPSAHSGAKLISVRGDKVEEYPLVPGVMTFGRFAANTIIIDNDPYVSGHHAQIIVEDDTYRFTDVGSTNGSRLNGEKVAANEPLTLSSGDEIAIGGSIFRLELPASS